MPADAMTRASMIHEAFAYGEAEHAHYEKQGYCIFDHFLTDDAIERCRRQMDRMVSELHPECTPEEMICPHQQGDRWVWDLGTEPRLLDMIERQIGPNIILWSSHALAKSPHTGIEVPWHQDAPYWNIGGPLAGAVWIPLDDVDEQNGTMSILSGLHGRGELPRLIDKPNADRLGHKNLFKQEIDPDALPDGAKVTYRLKAGQMGTHHTMLPHCSTPNSSERWRRVLGIRYMSAEGTLGDKTYEAYRTRKPFQRTFYLVRGEDVKGYGLPHSPFDD